MKIIFMQLNKRVCLIFYAPNNYIIPIILGLLFKGFNSYSFLDPYDIIGGGEILIQMLIKCVHHINYCRTTLLGKKENSFTNFWKIKTLPSSLPQFLLGRVISDRVVSKLDLVRRGIVVESILCPMCGREDEDTNHLFFRCREVWGIWNICNIWVGMHHNQKRHFDHFNILGLSSSQSRVWKCIWMEIIWIL